MRLGTDLTTINFLWFALEGYTIFQNRIKEDFLCNIAVLIACADVLPRLRERREREILKFSQRSVAQCLSKLNSLRRSESLGRA